ncbi:MAG: 3-hydroxyacyl-CoA dehydrogenase NAD-binding domain-containing protein, partial [Saprospiraceae bacterium]
MANKIGIIGAGAMGQGIAQVAVTQGEIVFIYDAKVEMSQKAIIEIRANLEKLISKGKFDSAKLESTLGNLESVASIAELAKCDIVIEAAVENLPIKRQIFEELESIVSDHCILASNTSSLSITSIASACKRPERVVGMHFFNPA